MRDDQPSGDRACEPRRHREPLVHLVLQNVVHDTTATNSRPSGQSSDGRSSRRSSTLVPPAMLIPCASCSSTTGKAHPSSTMRRRFCRTVELPVVVVSNIDRQDIQAAIDLHGLAFETVITSEDVRSYKPRPELFVAGLQAARCEPPSGPPYRRLAVERRRRSHSAQHARCLGQSNRKALP